MHRSKFLTFLTALIPGVGYMYLGLVKRGVQALVIFLLIEPIFKFIGLREIGDIIQIVMWFYTFFDTFSLAARIDRGDHVSDSDFILNKYKGNDAFSSYKKVTSDKKILLIAAWALIVIGSLALVNKIFYTNEIFGLIRSYINMYFLPVILVLAGVYLLLKNK